MDTRGGYSTPFFIAGFLIFLVALFILRRRKARGALYLILLCLAASVWSTTEGMLYLGFDAKINILITKLQYFGISPMPPLALIFGLSVFGFESWITRTRIILLFLIAAAIITLVWTNSLHHLVFIDYYTIDTGPFPMLGLKHGLLWWLIIIYHYSLMAVLSVFLLSLIITSVSFYRLQAVVILIAVIVVWIVNAIYVSGNSPVPNMDITPLAFILVAGSMAWGFFRYNLLDILPVAKAEIFRGLSDAILVLDEKNRVMDINPAAESMFNIDVSGTIGLEARQVFSGHPQFYEKLCEMKAAEVYHTFEGQERVYGLRVSALKDKREARLGRVIILHDITERKRAETEKSELIAELQDSLREVRALRGILAICSSCKKIRDDKGYWNQIEAYIRDHSEADFSHGICPECAKKLYPDYDIQ